MNAVKIALEAVSSHSHRTRLLAPLAVAKSKIKASKSGALWVTLSVVTLAAVAAALCFIVPAQAESLWTICNYRGQRAFDKGAFGEAKGLLSMASLISNCLPQSEQREKKLISLATLSDLESANGHKAQAAEIESQISKIATIESTDQQAQVNEMIERLRREIASLKQSNKNVTTETRELIDDLCGHAIDLYKIGWANRAVSNYWTLLQTTHELLSLVDEPQSALMGRCLQDQGDYIVNVLPRGGQVFSVQNRPSALEYFEQAAHIYEQPVNGIDERDRADVLVILSKAFLRLGSVEDQQPTAIKRAHQLAYEAKRIYLKEPREYDPYIASVLVVESRIFVYEEKWQRARDLIAQADHIYSHVSPLTVPDRFGLEISRGIYYEDGIGDHKKARNCLDSLLDYLERQGKGGQVELLILDTLKRAAKCDMTAQDFSEHLALRTSRALAMQQRLEPQLAARRYGLYEYRFQYYWHKAKKDKSASDFENDSLSARNDLEQMMDMLEGFKEVQPPKKQIADNWQSLAYLRSVTGDLPGAVNAQHEAYSLSTPNHKSFARFGGDLLLASAEILNRRGLRDKAQRTIDQARALTESDRSITETERHALLQSIDKVARLSQLK